MTTTLLLMNFAMLKALGKILETIELREKRW